MGEKIHNFVLICDSIVIFVCCVLNQKSLNEYICQNLQHSIRLCFTNPCWHWCRFIVLKMEEEKVPFQFFTVRYQKRRIVMLKLSLLLIWDRMLPLAASCHLSHIPSVQVYSCKLLWFSNMYDNASSAANCRTNYTNAVVLLRRAISFFN